MDIEHLVTMANQIGSFFESESVDANQAAKEVASHLRRFWEPRMRKQIVAHYQRGAAGLEDIPRDAVAMLAAESTAEVDAAPKTP